MKIPLPILAVSAIMFASCCPDKQCPVFNNDLAMQWIPQSLDDTLFFQNAVSTDSNIRFIVRSKTVTEAYKIDADRIFMCPEKHCDIIGSITAWSDELSTVQSLEYFIAMETEDDDFTPRELKYRLGDFNGMFQVNPILSVNNRTATTHWNADTIISSITLGGVQYDNVVLQSKNPSDTANHFQIQQVYLAPGIGIIAFSNKTALYYRKQ